MANATEMVEGDVGVYDTKRYDVAADLTITIPYEVQEGSVQIRGLKEAVKTAPMVMIAEETEGDPVEGGDEGDGGDDPESTDPEVTDPEVTPDGEDPEGGDLEGGDDVTEPGDGETGDGDGEDNGDGDGEDNGDNPPADDPTDTPDDPTDTPDDPTDEPTDEPEDPTDEPTEILPEVGTYFVTITPATAETAGKTVITLNAADVSVGDQLRVTCYRRVVNAKRVVVKTNTPTARGLVEIEYPVYSAGTDCTESAIKGKLRLRIHRCRVTALPGFDTSYKTAATNSVTFAAMDPKRADGQVYELIWEEYDTNGNAIAKSEGAVDWKA